MDCLKARPKGRKPCISVASPQLFCGLAYHNACLRPTWVWLDASCSWVRSCTSGIFIAFDSEVRWTMRWGSIVATWQHRMTVPGDLLGPSLCTLFFYVFLGLQDLFFCVLLMWPCDMATSGTSWHAKIQLKSTSRGLGPFGPGYYVRRSQWPCQWSCWKPFGNTHFEIHFKTLEIPYHTSVFYTQLITGEARCPTKGLAYTSKAPSCQLSKRSKTKMMQVQGVRNKKTPSLRALVPCLKSTPRCGPAPRRSLAGRLCCWRASSQDLG